MRIYAEHLGASEEIDRLGYDGLMNSLEQISTTQPRQKRKSADLCTTHRLLDEPYDDHQDASADTARNNLPDDCADIETSCTGCFSAATKKLTDDLRPDTTADQTGNSISDDSQIKLLQ